MNFQSSQTKFNKCRVPLNILSSVYKNNVLYRRNKYFLVLCVVGIACTIVYDVAVDINFVVPIVVVIVVYCIRVVVAVTAVVQVGVGVQVNCLVVVPLSNTAL